MERKVSDAIASILEAAATRPEPKQKTKNPGSKPRGGNRYMIWDETKIRPKLSVQAVFILRALANAGDAGMTKYEIAELARNAPNEFPCNQPLERAIGFYLSEFKSEGALAFARASISDEMEVAA